MEAEQLVKEAVALAMARDGSSGGVIRMVAVHEGGADRSLVLPEVTTIHIHGKAIILWKSSIYSIALLPVTGRWAFLRCVVLNAISRPGLSRTCLKMPGCGGIRMLVLTRQWRRPAAGGAGSEDHTSLWHCAALGSSPAGAVQLCTLLSASAAASTA